MKKSLNFLKRKKYYLLLILILAFVFWIWWIPGPRVAGDFSFIATNWLKLQLDIPRVWTERGADGLGGYGFFLIGSWPVSVIFGSMAHLGMNFEIWERILIVVFIFMGSFSIWKLLGSYTLSSRAKFIGSMFYLINSYSILLIDGGQIFIALAYALFPLAFLYASKAATSKVVNKIFAGLLIVLVGFFDVRFIYLLLLLILAKAFFDIFIYRTINFYDNLKNWIGAGLIIGFMILAFNSIWLIVQFSVPLDDSIVVSFTKISTNFVNIGHSLLAVSPHWYKNIFGKISLIRGEFILLPILAFLAPILKKKDKDILFWLFIAIVSVFLAKGESEPIPSFYSWLHSNIPGFSFFRDSTKFFFLIALSYSVLISKTSEIIIEKISNKKLFSKIPFGIIYVFCMLVYLLFLIRPVFLNQMTGTLSVQPLEEEFKSLAIVLKADNSFGRVLWIPSTVPLSYYDLNHPVIEPIRIFDQKPFAYGVKGGYELFNFLREAPYMGEIFDVAGISYIAYPYLDLRRDEINTDNINYYYTFLNQLTNLPWVKEQVSESKIPLLKVNNHQDRVFITKNTWLVFGSDEVFIEATKSAHLKLADNAIVFAETEQGMLDRFSQKPEVKVVLNNKTKTDLIANFIPASKIIFPAKQLQVDPDRSGWWKNDGSDIVAWRDFLQTKYGIDNKDFDLGGGWAVGEGKRDLKIMDGKLKPGQVLLARVLESSRSGELKFYQGGQEIGELTTKITGNSNVRWFEIGKLNSENKLTISSDGGINILNALAVVKVNDLKAYRDKASGFEKQITTYQQSNAASGSGLATFKQINPTLYKISISNLTHPTMIVFSSAFHPGWKLNGVSSVPVYGFLNGFRVEKNGDYLLEFYPQKYVWGGLILFGISLLTLILVLIYLIYPKKC